MKKLRKKGKNAIKNHSLQRKDDSHPKASTSGNKEKSQQKETTHTIDKNRAHQKSAVTDNINKKKEEKEKSRQEVSAGTIAKMYSDKDKNVEGKN